MARIKKFDSKSVKNRARVRKFRERKKLISIHKNRVQNLIIGRIKPSNTENTKSETHHEPNISESETFTNKLNHWALKNRISAATFNICWL